MISDETHERIQNAALKTNGVLHETGSTLDETKEKLAKLNQEFSKVADTIKDNFSKSIADAINGGNTFSSTFDKIRKSLEEFAIRTAVLNPLSDILFGGKSARLDQVNSVDEVLPTQGKSGLLGDLANSIADLFGARAFGGPVGAGQPYLVGERGPELFVPQTAGSINPNIGGGSVNIVMNISATDAASFQASQTQIAASMMDAARRAQRIR